jgi:hypothetical protein
MLPDGQTIFTATEYDPTLVNGLLAVVKEYENTDFGLFCNNTNNKPFEVVNAVDRIASYPQLLINSIVARGWPISSTVFPSGDASWPAFLRDYCVAYTILRTVLTVPEAVYINVAFRRIAAAVSASGIPNRARQLWYNLQLIPMAPGFCKLLDQIFGIIDAGEGVEDFSFITYLNPNGNPGTVTDFTSVSDVQKLLDTAQASIDNIDAGKSGVSPLLQFIHEILSRAYGVEHAFEKPMPIKDVATWDLHYTSATYLNVATGPGTNQYIAVPTITPASLVVNNVAVPAGVIPVLNRRGHPMHPLAMTLFRPLMYDSQTSSSGPTDAGSRVMVGLFNVGANNSTRVRVYSNAQNTGLDNTILNDGLNVTQVLGGTFNVTGRAGSSMWDTNWWKPIAYSTLQADGNPNWIYDTRSYADYDRYNFPTFQLSTATTKMLDGVFLASLRK